MPSIAFKFEVILKNYNTDKFYCLNSNIADKIKKWYKDEVLNTTNNKYNIKKLKIIYDETTKKFIMFVDIDEKELINIKEIKYNLIDSDKNYNKTIKIRNNDYMIIGNSIGHKII